MMQLRSRFPYTEIKELPFKQSDLQSEMFENPVLENFMDIY